MNLPPTWDAGPSRRLDTRYSLHALTEEEETTCKGLLQIEPSACMTMLPTHHMDADGHLNGFRFQCNGDAPASCLPISRQMFFGHAAVECEFAHSAVERGEDEASILSVMQRKQEVRTKLEAICQKLSTDTAPRATLDCVPENDDAMVAHRTLHATDLRTMDTLQWNPDPPVTLGVYHAYVRGYSRDIRSHKMFIACSGGLDAAADEYCNLMIDVGTKWTAKNVAESMETWWLRRAAQRARARLLYLAADALKLQVNHINDINAYEPRKVAIPFTDVIQHNVALKQADGASTVAIYNGCTPTTVRFNGILVRMAPSEGMRIFQGARSGNGYGSVFGSDKVCGVFPVCQPRTTKPPIAVPVPDATYVYRTPPPPGTPPTSTPHYMCFDEAYHKTLEQMEWNRDNGVVELIPIAVWARDNA